MYATAVFVRELILISVSRSYIFIYFFVIKKKRVVTTDIRGVAEWY